MGHNCSGVKRTARMKRAKRHEARLAKKYAAAEGVPSKTTGVLGTVKKAAAGVVHAVGAAVHAVAGTLTGKKEEAVKK
ncbi:MAG TPA: hypothetical protein DDY78_13590 [Planctomycetales bacterium]|nr:hypothetical protein [Planctomycetales bacterium]